MAWDSLPPTPEELKGPTSWDSAPPSPDELKQLEPKSLAGLGHNAMSDVGEMATGIGQTIKKGAYDLPKMATESLAQTVGDTVTGKDSGTTPIGDELANFANNSPELGKSMVEPVVHPIEYGYKHPVSQAMNVLGAGEGALDTLGQYSKRFGQNQAMKAMGASGGQIGQVGIPESRLIAQDMIDKGVVSPFRGPIALEDKVSQLHSKAGADIGASRALADKSGEAPQMMDILDQVKNSLVNKYTSGMEKGMGGLNRAREEVAKGGTGTFTGNAQKATDINSAAAKNKIYRPDSAATDTADIISHMNNAKMQQVLKPADFAKYEGARKDYGNLDKAKQFLERGERREMGGRGGASLGKTVYDKTMDAFGNRAAASLGSGLGDALLNVPRPSAAQALAAYLARQNEEEQP